MKRRLTCIAAVLFAAALCGCASPPEAITELAISPTVRVMSDPAVAVKPAETPDPETDYTELPVLTVTVGADTITAMCGAYSWEYDNGDGTWGAMETDCAHVLDAQDDMPSVTIDPAGLPHAAELTFEYGSAPDSIQVFCWDDSHWGEPASESEEIAVESGTISLKSGQYIYEIVAEWTSAAHYRGTVHYAFYTEAAASTALTVQAGGTCIEPYPFLLSSLQWTERGLLAGCGLSLGDELPRLAENSELPVMIYADDFSIAHAPAVHIGAITLYDAAFSQLDECVESLEHLPAGTYYAAISYCLLGDYIEQENVQEYENWAGLFEIQIA